MQRDEHFWTLSFGVMVGSLHVRIRRDADEQLVLAHVWNKLAGLVQILTIHVFKDDWMRRTTHQLVYNAQEANFQLAPPASLPQLLKFNQQQQQSQANKLNNPNATVNPQSTINPASNIRPTFITSGMNQLSQQPVKSMISSQASGITSSLHKSPTNSTLMENDYVIVNP
jgi:hypothetical protein